MDVRKDFPILRRSINGCPLAYLDSGASAQQPNHVTDAVTMYHQNNHANIHRGIHTLSQEATDLYEEGRHKVAKFINADPSEIIFTSGTTESINLVANSFLRPRIPPRFHDSRMPKSQVLITELEHHSNIVPWQQPNVELNVAPINDRGEVLLKDVVERLNHRTLLVAIAHISNALGTILPVGAIVDQAHEKNIPVLVDGAQGIVHGPVDVKELGCDFYAFSSHKMYGPTGFGVLYATKKMQAVMEPWQVGGGMIERVTFDKTTFIDGPSKFEAGTPNISAAVGITAAIEYIEEIGFDVIQDHESELLEYLIGCLEAEEGVTLIGTATNRSGVVSFIFDEYHSSDIGELLDRQGVAVRTGHHCAQPVMNHFNIPGTIRVSLGVYNTKADIDQLITAIQWCKVILG